MRFPFVRPQLPPPSEWIPFLDEPYARRYFTNFGVVESQFSEALAARYGGTDCAVTLACNATIGLVAALVAHGVRGKVAVPDFTFPATLNAVVAAGCEPVICDIDRDTLELSPDALAAAGRVHEIAAIMPVRAYGIVRDFSAIREIAAAWRVPVIVDAAAALGAGRIQVAENLTEVVSLHATKSFGIGEGGVIFTHPSRRPALMSALNFGLGADRRFGRGLNGKMTEMQAAVGLALMPRIDALIAGRRAMAEWYQTILGQIEGMELPGDPKATAWSNFPILLPRQVDTAALQDRAHALGFQVRRYYWPSLAEGCKEDVSVQQPLHVTREVSERAVCLPLYSELFEEEKIAIASILSEVFADCGIPQLAA